MFLRLLTAAALALAVVFAAPALPLPGLYQAGQGNRDEFPGRRQGGGTHYRPVNVAAQA